jgi:hypothetical protein
MRAAGPPSYLPRQILTQPPKTSYTNRFEQFSPEGKAAPCPQPLGV